MTRSYAEPIAAAWLLGFVAMAADLPGLSNESVIPIPFTETSPVCEAIFWIDANPSITFRLGSSRRDLRLMFTDPNGMRWDIAAPSGDLAEAGTPEIRYKTTIQKPVPGQWRITVAAATPPIPGTGLVITYQNGVTARMSMPRTTVTSGDLSPARLELRDGDRGIHGATIAATLTRQGDASTEPVFVQFSENGSDGKAQEGMYTALLPTETPGTYRLEAQIEALTAAGRSQRTATLLFKVVPKAAYITGVFTQRILAGTPQ